MSRRASSRSVGRVRELVRSWERYLRAGNQSPRTIQSYAEAALQFDAWLDEQNLPVDVGVIERRDIEAWLASLLERWKPATAAAWYRSTEAESVSIAVSSIGARICHRPSRGASRS